jgi:hypothetical protein
MLQVVREGVEAVTPLVPIKRYSAWGLSARGRAAFHAALIIECERAGEPLLRLFFFVYFDRQTRPNTPGTDLSAWYREIVQIPVERVRSNAPRMSDLVYCFNRERRWRSTSHFRRGSWCHRCATFSERPDRRAGQAHAAADASKPRRSGRTCHACEKTGHRRWKQGRWKKVALRRDQSRRAYNQRISLLRRNKILSCGASRNGTSRVSNPRIAPRATRLTPPCVTAIVSRSSAVSHATMRVIRSA